jgi:hypothetical protein
MFCPRHSFLLWSGGVGGAVAVITNGLLAADEFNDNGNGNENNGVVNAATSTTDRFGNLDSAYNFDETRNYIDLGNQKFTSVVGSRIDSPNQESNLAAQPPSSKRLDAGPVNA